MSWWHQLSPELRGDAMMIQNIVEQAGGSFNVTSVRRTGTTARRLERTYGAQCCTQEQHSAHADGHAFDVVIEPFNVAVFAGKTWRSWGHHWESRDPPHFEA